MKSGAPMPHALPADLRGAIAGSAKAQSAWLDISPVARNEWICWVVSAKKPETRALRLGRTKIELAEGKRRPCCWMGCIHRTDKPMSASQKFVVKRQAGKKSA